ncbi:MAG: hypothetical protein U1F36_18710 [Planctomycetota bacterium]
MLAIARIWAVFLGGTLFGSGLLLHAQIMCLHYAREEVDNTFFLWRAIGGLTFVFQDDVTKAALWAHEVPEPVLRESDRAGWTLIVIGAICVVASLFMHPRRQRR